MTAGETLFLRATISTDGHVWIVVCCDPNQGALLANMTSDLSFEPLCVLDPGDHPFVTKKTVVAYEHAKYIPPSLISPLESKGIDRKLDDLTPAILRRVQDGVLQSRHTTPR